MLFFEKKKSKNCYEKNVDVKIDAIHIYPETIVRIVNHLVVPSKNFLTLANSEETIDTFHDSEDSDSTDLESSEDEPSSGYQTSEVKSPQILVNQKMIHSVWKIHNTSVIYHCTDELRNNLIICQFDLKMEKENDEKGIIRNHINLNINKLTHYVNGEFSDISRKMCFILKPGKTTHEQATPTDTLTVSAVAIHLRPRLTTEVANMLGVTEDIKSLLTSPDIADLTRNSDMWSQMKMVRNPSSDWSKNNPMMGLWRRLDSGWMNSVNLKCDLPSVSFYFYNEDNEHVLAMRMKSSGMFKTFQKIPQYGGALAVEAVVKDTKINRWQHLFHTDYKNRNIANVDVCLGLLDVDSLVENLDEVPLTKDRRFLFTVKCKLFSIFFQWKALTKLKMILSNLQIK